VSGLAATHANLTRAFMFAAVLLILVQLPLVPGLDIGDIDRWLITIAGCGAMLLYAIRNKLTPIDYYVLIPAIVLALVSLANHVPGHTEYAVAYNIGLAGIVMVAMRSKIRPVMWALVATVAIQMIFRYTQIIPWSMTGLDDKDALWGTFRHRIRYSTLIMVGLVGCWYVFEHTRKTKWLAVIVALAGAAAIALADSNTIQAIVAIGIIIWAFRVNKYLGMSAAFALLAIALQFGNGEWTHTNGRSGIWLSCFTASTDSLKHILIGYGANSWILHTGAIGWQGLGHPHCSLLEFAFNYGLIAAALAALWYIPIVGISLCRLPIAAGLSAILLSTLTNSASYPEVGLLIATFTGLCLNETYHAIADCSTGDNRSTSRNKSVSVGCGCCPAHTVVASC